MYTLNETGYKLYNKYETSENEQGNNVDVINILYINNNHYNLLVPQKNKNNKNNILIRNINFKEMGKILIKDKLSSNGKISD